MTASLVESMPDSEYHATRHVSASRAKLCLESMQLYKDVEDGLVPHNDSPALEVGRIAHMAVLEPERFARQIRVEGPINPKTNKMFGRDTQAWKDWEAEHPGVMVVDPWLFTSLQRMPDEVRDLYSAGRNEVSCFAEINGLPVKCRPDCLLLSEGEVIDHKTIDNIHKCERQIAALSYWFSAGWYRAVLYSLFNRPFGYTFIFQEKAFPCRWRKIRLSEAYLDLADEKAAKVMEDLSTAYRTGEWGDTSDLNHVIDPPQWLDPDDFTVTEEGISL